MVNLKYIYAFVFASLAGWAIFAYITTTDIIKNQQQYAKVINKTGSQRMLSQKITLLAYRFYETRDKEHKSHLLSLYSLMRSEHEKIISLYVKSDVTKALYFEKPRQLNNKVEQYFKNVEEFIAHEELSLLYKLESSSFSLLPLLEDAVNVFEQESKKKVDLLLDRELFILVGTIITLILESVFIVIPAIRHAEIHEDKLKNLVKERTLELEKISVTDQLTKLYNRRKTDETLSFEMERAKRSHGSFGIIMIDIDNFKKVNDTYGHLTGDDVLQEIARILSDNVRKIDVLGRWGGEEFLIVDNESDPDKVIEFAEKIRSAVEKHKFKQVGKVTCSFGVTQYVEGDTTASLIIRADKAMYAAKEAGRNCVKEMLA
ncbi:MAG: diguanylate cyclase [Gammaproteobacteria bacterium]|nr:diguanylate cyclase [Gammaproteobacteria bacterium]